MRGLLHWSWRALDFASTMVWAGAFFGAVVLAALTALADLALIPQVVLAVGVFGLSLIGLTLLIQYIRRGRQGGSYVLARTVLLPELVRDVVPPIIRDRVFEDCDIIGPVIAYFTDTTIDRCEWGADGDLDSILFEVPKNRKTLIGAVELRRCVFRKCRFRSVGVVGTREQLNHFRRGFR